ncbi:OLC1v1026806C8 [Oldenlandia corymbosa var. corymbosa]|nr:OLC1v1026806C8 [Oldenlandia corymbosa var. corymbosa]
MMSRHTRQSLLMVPTTRGKRSKLMTITVGKFYQIVHANLPPRTPPWLRAIRVVMVSDKNKLKVTVKYPSQAAIDSWSSSQDKACSNPELDLCFIMGYKLAQRVLFADVNVPKFNSVEEIKGFWLVKSPKLEIEDVPLRTLRSAMKRDAKKEEIQSEVPKLAIVKVENIVKEEIGGDEPEADDATPKMKKYKWWSNDSFDVGKKVILRILKEKKAGADNPIYRAALRREAQKEIGNTGLLDHLLKDIPGKIAPDGASRFQRCYNADGVIMYWLENADLVDLRKKAGVADPFWIPPPGWKVGSCSSGCPCSKELEQLKEEFSQVKRDLEETQKQLTEVRAANNEVRRDLEETQKQLTEVRAVNTEVRRCSDCDNWVGGFW